MQLILNGKPREFDTAPTVSELLAALELAGSRLAVEVNREIIPRSRHDLHRLSEADSVEIVHAIGGG